MYRKISVIFLNFVLLFVLVNAGSYIALRVWGEGGTQPDTNPWVSNHGLEKLSRFFPERNPDDINAFLNETWVATQTYAPFYQIRSVETKGRYLNVAAEGFRENGVGQASWPPSPTRKTVFLFGGSTTFGSGVEDKHTVASFLQRNLRELGNDVDVFNFGTGSHFSTVERMMFDQITMKGLRPDVAVFIDGLNDSYFWNGEPAHTEWYRQASKIIQDYAWRFDAWFHLTHLLKAMPIGKLAARFWEINEKPPFWKGQIKDADDPQKVAAVIDRWFQNRDRILKIAETLEIQTVFVWQPVPMYNYPGWDKIKSAFGEAIGGHARSAYTYPAMKERFEDLWCADIQEGIDEILYVDHVHYNPKMADMLARCLMPSVISALGLSDR